METGEIINVYIMDEKLEGPLGVLNYELVPIGGRVKEHALQLVEWPEWPGWTFGTDPREDSSRLAWSRIGPSQVLPPNGQAATGCT